MNRNDLNDSGPDNVELDDASPVVPARRRRLGERGASLIEYALLIALIAVVCVGAITQFGGSNGEGIDRSADSIVNAGLP